MDISNLNPDVITILIILGVVIAITIGVGVIKRSISNRARQARIAAARRRTPPVTTPRTPPPQPQPPPPPQASTQGFVAGERRPRPPIITTTVINGAPAEFGSQIALPSSIEIVHNQKLCPYCGKSIAYSFEYTGWARCRTTRKLVHGHCHDAWREHNSSCMVCKTDCNPRYEGRSKR